MRGENLIAGFSTASTHPVLSAGALAINDNRSATARLDDDKKGAVLIRTLGGNKNGVVEGVWRIDGIICAPSRKWSAGRERAVGVARGSAWGVPQQDVARGMDSHAHCLPVEKGRFHGILRYARLLTF